MKLIKRVIYDSSCSYCENYIPSESQPGQLVDIMNNYDYVVEYEITVVENVIIKSTKSDDKFYF